MPLFLAGWLPPFNLVPLQRSHGQNIELCGNPSASCARNNEASNDEFSVKPWCVPLRLEIILHLKVMHGELHKSRFGRLIEDVVLVSSLIRVYHPPYVSLLRIRYNSTCIYSHGLHTKELGTLKP